jgi:Putative adhesin
MTDGTTKTAARRLPMTAGRRVTLVFGVPVVLALIAVTGLSAADQLASASFPVSYAFPPGNGPLTTQIANGGVTLRQSAAVSTPVLNGIAHYSLRRSTFTHSGDTVQYHCPWQVGNCELDATLLMPATSAVSLATEGGDVNIPSFSQDVTLATGGGDLTAGTVSGRLNLNTAGGDMSVTEFTGPSANLNSGGGDVTIRGLATSGTATVDSGGGDVSVTCTKAPTNLEITSRGGDVSIVLPPGPYAFNSNADGGDLNEPSSAPQATDTITVQSGGGDINISESS